MKKLLVSLVTLVLVFAVVASVSAAAPTVTGKLQFEGYSSADSDANDNTKNYSDARIFFNGEIDPQTTYTVATQYNSGWNEFRLREAYVTYKSGIGDFSVGKIRVIPTIADLTDGIAPLQGNGITNASFVVRYGYNFSDDTNFALTVVPVKNNSDYVVLNDDKSVNSEKTLASYATSFTEAGTFVAEVHTKASIFNLGANLQFEGEGDPGFALQASTKLSDALSVWAEAGQFADKSKDLSSKEKSAYLLGASYTIGKWTLEAEQQFNDDVKYMYGHDQWGAKVGYALTDNVAIEYYRSSNYYLGGLEALNNDGSDQGVSFLRVTVLF